MAVAGLIVGLGNPGKQYESTRHNMGFLFVDELLREAKNVSSMSGDKFRCELWKAALPGSPDQWLIAKPQTFMNNSGLAVMDAVNFYKLPPERVIVVFDDISLPVGRLRVRADGSAGGHNGIKSIIGCLNSQSFPRVKIGVGQKPHPDYDLADWVLSNFTKDEDAHVTRAAEAAAEAVLTVLTEGVPAAAAKFNGAHE